MKRSIIVAFVALCLSALIGLPALAERPSISKLNAEVNQLQAQVEALQSDSLIVIDGSGNELGALINNNLSVTEFQFFFDALAVILIVGAESGVVARTARNVFFDLPDCEGQPYSTFLNRF